MSDSGELALDDLLAPGAAEKIADPYPLYRKLRDGTPVVEIPNPTGGLGGDSNPGVVMVMRYDDVKSVLRNDGVFTSGVNNRTIGLVMGPSIVGMDGREHLKHRKLVTPALAPRALRGDFARLVERIAHELIDRFADEGEADLRPQFTFTYPLKVFVEILGLSGEDVDQFHQWSIDLIRAFSDFERGMAASRNMLECLMPAIERKRDEDANDLISSLARAEVDGERLTDFEIVSFLRLLVTAGAETTYHLLGSTLVALLRDEALLERVRNDRSLIEPLLHEILRWETPVSLVNREAIEDTEIAGFEIAKGTSVFCHLGSANRDERRFREPDIIDIGRENTEHLAFGFGKHYCAGSRLALLEAEVGLNALLDRLPELTAKPDEDFGMIGVAFRGPNRLPVRFGAAH